MNKFEAQKDIDFEYNITNDNMEIVKLANNLGCAFVYPEEADYDYINNWLDDKGMMFLDLYVHNNIDFKTMTIKQLKLYLEAFHTHRFYIFIHYFKSDKEILARMKQFTDLDDFINNFDDHKYNLQISKKEPIWYEFVDTKQIKK